MSKNSIDLRDYIFDDDAMFDNIIDWINTNLNPDDIFDYDTLEDWAFDNGFVRREDIEE